MFRKKQQPRPALHIPRPSDDAVLKQVRRSSPFPTPANAQTCTQPLTAHTRNKESADSTSTTAGGRKSSLDSAFAAPPVALAKNPLSMDSSWRGRIQPVPVPAPLPQQQNKLRKPRRGPVSPTLKNGQQASNVQPTLPSVAPDPLPLPLPSPAPYVSTPFVLPYREKPSSAEFPEPPPAPPLAASRGPTPEFDPLAHRSHMHRFSQLLSEPGQRLSFIFDELTRRAVQSPFSPSLPDELLVRAGEDVAVLECFDDGWSVVQRPLPAAEGGGGGGGVEQGVIPTQCWAGLPREELEPGQVPMRYSSLRHGVDQGVFEIGTAL
ncbi:hypothetical protein CALVIDRAFT_533350 [Calocera viscosa TUFC12733]|uniref:SH3 domain-containing protein n=1 Tax=Calocera viscosa (strain TUFC12733) TaxID=1330018 RepID=A0A167QX83_CALVF|nr:hypothetical protein CALVIDRAFT_533350 [Calocera viscosa TUFC12733]